MRAAGSVRRSVEVGYQPLDDLGFLELVAAGPQRLERGCGEAGARSSPRKSSWS
jgi:hypothetical protein